MLLGIGSRKFAGQLPLFIAEYSGDTLWALMIFLMFGFLFAKYSTARIALFAFIFSFGIEFSQLYQADWLNALRSTKFGGLILGYGFLWSDLLCYSIGIITGVCLEKIFFEKKSKVK